MALFPPNYIKSVVSIEIETADLQGKLEMRSIATGFLLGRKARVGTGYHVFLVTNRHVFETDKGDRLKEVDLRFNLTDPTKKTKHFKTQLVDAQNNQLWLRHPDPRVHIAVIPLSSTALGSEGIEYYFFQDDTDLFIARDFETTGISTGDGIFVLGFPLGIRGTERNYVIARQGIIARVDEELLLDHYFLIDASAYPGNSGGPVIHRPEVVSITGTSACSRAGLVGVISSGITYTDVAVSRQTGEPRIIFTEQTGLVRIVPVESVLEVIDQFINTMQPSKPAPPAPVT